MDIIGKGAEATPPLSRNSGKLPTPTAPPPPPPSLQRTPVGTTLESRRGGGGGGAAMGSAVPPRILPRAGLSVGEGRPEVREKKMPISKKNAAALNGVPSDPATDFNWERDTSKNNGDANLQFVRAAERCAQSFGEAINVFGDVRETPCSLVSCKVREIAGGVKVVLGIKGGLGDDTSAHELQAIREVEFRSLRPQNIVGREQKVTFTIPSDIFNWHFAGESVLPFRVVRNTNGRVETPMLGKSVLYIMEQVSGSGQSILGPNDKAKIFRRVGVGTYQKAAADAAEKARNAAAVAAERARKAAADAAEKAAKKEQKERQALVKKQEKKNNADAKKRMNKFRKLGGYQARPAVKQRKRAAPPDLPRRDDDDLPQLGDDSSGKHERPAKSQASPGSNPATVVDVAKSKQAKATLARMEYVMATTGAEAKRPKIATVDLSNRLAPAEAPASAPASAPAEAPASAPRPALALAPDVVESYSIAGAIPAGGGGGAASREGDPPSTTITVDDIEFQCKMVHSWLSNKYQPHVDYALQNLLGKSMTELNERLETDTGKAMVMKLLEILVVEKFRKALEKTPKNFWAAFTSVMRGAMANGSIVDDRGLLGLEAEFVKAPIAPATEQVGGGRYIGEEGEESTIAFYMHTEWITAIGDWEKLKTNVGFKSY